MQSRADEVTLARELAEGYDVVAVPTRWRGPEVRPQLPQELETRGLVLFPERHWEAVEANITAVTDGSGDHHVFPSAGWCIRWNRTKPAEGGVLRAGRCYLDDDEIPGAEAAIARSREVFAFIDTYIRWTYPGIRIADEASPTYIGPDLADRLARGRAVMNKADGTAYGVRPNPEFRGPG